MQTLQRSTRRNTPQQKTGGRKAGKKQSLE
jgi:hypothetical protein